MIVSFHHFVDGTLGGTPHTRLQEIPQDSDDE